MTPPDDSDSRPAGNETGHQIADYSQSIAADARPGAQIAAGASPWWAAEQAWDQAIREYAAAGEPFTVDEVQQAFDLPDAGSAIGGFVTRFARAGVIRHVGWRRSTKPSRAGGGVTVWSGA